jgi:hypothetical protein
MFKSKLFIALMVSVFVFTSCTSNEIGESKDVAQEKIYHSYNITFTEGNTNAEVFCQFRFAGSNGTTLVLNKPSKILFDNENMIVDSSDASGAYYKVFKPVANFYGNHSFSFTDINNKKIENTVAFDSFKLINVPAIASKQQPIILPYTTTALQGNDYIEITSMDTDSSFSITHTATDASQFITIPAKELQRQTGKQLFVQATLYKSIPLRQYTTEGGKISLQYALAPVKIMLGN